MLKGDRVQSQEFSPRNNPFLSYPGRRFAVRPTVCCCNYQREGTSSRSFQRKETSLGCFQREETSLLLISSSATRKGAPRNKRSLLGMEGCELVKAITRSFSAERNVPSAVRSFSAERNVPPAVFSGKERPLGCFQREETSLPLFSGNKKPLQAFVCKGFEKLMIISLRTGVPYELS